MTHGFTIEVVVRQVEAFGSISLTLVTTPEAIELAVTATFIFCWMSVASCYFENVDVPLENIDNHPVVFVMKTADAESVAGTIYIFFLSEVRVGMSVTWV